MPLRKSDLMMTELTDFLDKLPKVPCEDPPTSRYFCTVCERLNKPVQSRCRIYKSHIDEVGLVRGAGRYEPSFEEEGEGLEAKGEGVEFKVVGDEDSGKEDESQQMPMFEIVKPSEDSEPLEMSLLEKEAIEFELMDDEGEEISPDALEVEPIEVEEEEFEGIEVEPLEVEEIEEEGFAELPPADEGKSVQKPKVKRAVKGKRSISKSGKKRVLSKAKRPSAKKRAVPAGGKAPTSAPKPAPTSGAVPTPVPQPRAGTPSTASPEPTFEEIPEDMLQDIEDQLILSSNCTICGAGLSNKNFCTQCGAQVIVSVEGVSTVPREEVESTPPKTKPVRKAKRKVVKK